MRLLLLLLREQVSFYHGDKGRKSLPLSNACTCTRREGFSTSMRRYQNGNIRHDHTPHMVKLFR